MYRKTHDETAGDELKRERPEAERDLTRGDSGLAKRRPNERYGRDESWAEGKTKNDGEKRNEIKSFETWQMTWNT